MTESLEDAIREQPELLFAVPTEQQTPALVWAALDSLPELLQAVVEPTYEMCEHVVDCDGLLIRDVPEHHCDERLLLRAVWENGMALQHIALDKRSWAVCHAAVRSSAQAYVYVPESHRANYTICSTVMAELPGMIGCFPAERYDPEFVIQAVKAGMYHFLDHSKMTNTLWVQVLLCDVTLWDLLPADAKTTEILASTLEHDYRALVHFRTGVNLPLGVVTSTVARDVRAIFYYKPCGISIFDDVVYNAVVNKWVVACAKWVHWWWS